MVIGACNPMLCPIHGCYGWLLWGVAMGGCYGGMLIGDWCVQSDVVPNSRREVKVAALVAQPDAGFAAQKASAQASTAKPAAPEDPAEDSIKVKGNFAKKVDRTYATLEHRFGPCLPCPFSPPPPSTRAVRYTLLGARAYRMDWRLQSDVMADLRLILDLGFIQIRNRGGADQRRGQRRGYRRKARIRHLRLQLWLRDHPTTLTVTYSQPPPPTMYTRR